MPVPLKMFFTIDKQAHSVQNSPGYNAMASCNCTSNIVIINVGTVYDMSFMIWKCEVHIWTQGYLACLYDIKAVFIIIVLSFKIVLLIYIISKYARVARLAEGWGQLLVMHGAQFQNGCQSKPIPCKAQSLRSDVIDSMLLYIHGIPI